MKIAAPSERCGDNRLVAGNAISCNGHASEERHEAGVGFANVSDLNSLESCQDCRNTPVPSFLH